MTPDCQHWSECGIRRGGCCALGLYGGKPSFGVCGGVCAQRAPHAHATPTLSAKLAHGIAGLAKAATGRDRVALDVLDARKAICNACPEKTAALGGVTTKCRMCGCMLPAKQRLASDRCPAGKWDAVASIGD